MSKTLSEKLGIEFPIFAFTHCRDVVVAVSKAGGIGVLGAVGFSPAQLKEELDWIDENIGDKLKQDYTGFDAWIITSNMEALKCVGLKTSVRHKMYNGGKESRFVCYNLYEGTKKGPPENI